MPIRESCAHANVPKRYVNGAMQAPVTVLSSVGPVLSQGVAVSAILLTFSADRRLVYPLKCLLRTHQDLEAKVGIEKQYQ